MDRVLGWFGGLSRAQRGHLAMLAFSALVAGSFSLGAMAAKFVSPAALTVARFALAGSLVGAVVRAYRAKPGPRRGGSWCWAGCWRRISC